MLDRLTDYGPCFLEPERWALATVVSTSGSAPRTPGASMAVRDDGLSIGSVSGGCVEAAVVDAAMTLLEDQSSSVLEFGYNDHDGLGVGLTCGGSLRIHLQPWAQLVHIFPVLQQAANNPQAPVGVIQYLPAEDGDVPAAQAVILDGAWSEHFVSHESEKTRQSIVNALNRGTNALLPVTTSTPDGCRKTAEIFVQARCEPPRMLIYGANDFAVALTRAAKPLGYRVTVCDARSLFATEHRHPEADEVIVQLPVEHLTEQYRAGRLDQRTVVVVLGHDPRFDLAILDEALRLPLAYVGAMGSAKTHQKRVADLRARGLTGEELAALHSPIGLDIGATEPAEIAISILSEIIVARRIGALTDGSINKLKDLQISGQKK